MKNNMKKLICILLAITVLTGISASAFAAKADNVKQYKTYLCLGDSISAGCGVPFEGVDEAYDASLQYWDTMYHGHGFEIVPRSYHALVAEAVGAKLIQGGVSGNRAVEMRCLLDGVYNDSDENGYWGQVFFGSDGSVESIKEKLNENDAALKAKFGLSYKDAIKKADLITVNLGSNDVLSYSAMFTMSILANEYESNCAITELLEKLAETGDVFGIFSQFLEISNTLGKLSEVLGTFAKCLYSSTLTYKTNWKYLVNDIKKINPDATLVAVGIYNPFNQFILSDSISVQVGRLMDPVVADLNLYLKSLEKTYSNYKYADCSRTEIYDFNMNNVSSGDYITKVHPTLKGHEYMTAQILSVLPERENQPDPESDVLPFKDVPENYWAYDEISYVYENNIMVGTSKTTFSPDKNMSRAEFATVLYRLSGADAKGLKEPFIDVSKKHWAFDAIAWAYNEGIVKGYDGNLFKPDENITRAQMVTMLYRYEGSPAVSGSLSMFKDKASIASPYKKAVIWAAQNGIVLGNTDGTFAPDAFATRAQMAAIIERYCTK